MSRFQSWHNPVPDWFPTRIDQGVDGTLSDKGFCAPFKCKILRAVDYTAGWKGGWLVAEILYGPYKGQGFFVAEGIKPVVHVGQIIPHGGIRIAERAINGYNNVFGNIECGWVAPSADMSLARTLPGYSGDQSIQAITCGSAFNVFIEQCGGRGGFNYSGLQPNWGLLPEALRRALQV
jgi:hypothetical protein